MPSQQDREVRAELRRLPDDRWSVDAGGASPFVADTRSAAIGRAMASLPDGAALVLEEVPDLVGVTEAAAILRWDRRRVATYIRRGSFPEPVASLAAGRVWRRRDVEAFAEGFRKRQARRGPRGPA